MAKSTPTKDEIRAAAEAMHDASLSHLPSPVPFSAMPEENQRQALRVAEAGIKAYLSTKGDAA